MKTFLSVVLIVLSVACVNGSPAKSKLTLPVKFKDCGSTLAKVDNVTVTPCTKEPCILHKGKNSTITISFTMNKDASSVTAAGALVYGILEGVKVPFKLDNPDVCKDCGVKCPLVPGQSYTYIYSLPISSVYPSLKLIVEWEINTSSKGLLSKAKQLETNSLQYYSKESDVKAVCIQIPVDVEK